MNLEEMNQEELIDLVKKLRSKRKYGLVWERDKTREIFDSRSLNSYPILRENSKNSFSSKKNSEDNILIEGDNYFALSILRNTHSGSIDFIYIDPPYNTGNNDFKYNDQFVDREDTYRHSKWLAFMYKRMEIARDLLSDEGVIFVSIGDDEQANLKLLLDEIFGENNFVGCIPRLAKTSSDKGNFYAPSKDYILAYKHPNRTAKFKDVLDEEYKKRFKGTDKRGSFATVGLYQASLDPMRGCANQRYWIECPDGSFIIPPGNVFPKKVSDGEFINPETKADKVWRWSWQTYLKQKEFLVFKETKRSPMLDQGGKPSKWNVDTKYYLEDREESGKRPRDWMENFLNTEGTNEIKRLGLDFSYPKPSSMIKYLISISQESNDIMVMDFFAGSGTTGDAVLQLNADDGGNRRFILVTNNEENICTEVCYPRIKKVSLGYTDNSGQKIEGLGGNLRYFETFFAERSNNTDEMSIRTAENCMDVLRLKEDIFTKISNSSESFSIYRDRDRLFAIYFSYDPSSLSLLREELLKLDANYKKLYVFSFDTENFDYQFFEDWKGVIVEPIPQQLLVTSGASDV